MSERSSQRPPVIQSLESMIEMLKLDKKYKEALKYGTNNYNVSQYKINKVKLEQIPQLVNLIDLNYINLERDLSQNSDKKKYNWLANQLKLFVWTSICHSFLINKPLEDYEETDWTFFTFIFTRKNSNDLEFQSKSLFKNYHGNKQKWDSEQQQLLRQIIDDEQNKNKWNEISRLLYFKSNKKYYRSSQKCRQYWFNHLDPALKKSPWTVDQDLRLVREIQIYGFKWSKLTQIIENNWGYRRTEHMVKNRTKFLCKKYGFKDDKEQGCTKQLKLIQKKLTEQKAKGIQGQKEEYDMNSGSQSAQDVKIQQKELNYNFLQRNVVQQRNQQQMKHEEKHEQKKPDFDESSESEDDDFESVKKPTKTSFKEEDKNNNKRNVIILYHAEKQKQAVNAPQPDIMEEEESPQIMLEQNNEENAQQSEQNCGNHKQESYYDEYNIIEEVPQIDLNQDIQFQHDTHGGRMRQRVTHELAKFFPSETGSQAN